MPVARIEDLTEAMIDVLGNGKTIDVVEIGSKPGEKMFEELMNEEEVRRTWDCGDFFVVLSAFADPTAPIYAHLAGKDRPDRAYCSNEETGMSKSELKKYLCDYEIL